jgi:hypothetical protein
VALDGCGTLPCPEPIHRGTKTNSTADATAGEENENSEHDNDER